MRLNNDNDNFELYVKQLKEMAVKCNYIDTDAHVIDHIISTHSDDRLRRVLLCQSQLSLEKVINAVNHHQIELLEKHALQQQTNSKQIPPKKKKNKKKMKSKKKMSKPETSNKKALEDDIVEDKHDLTVEPTTSSLEFNSILGEAKPSPTIPQFVLESIESKASSKETQPTEMKSHLSIYHNSQQSSEKSCARRTSPIIRFSRIKIFINRNSTSSNGITFVTTWTSKTPRRTTKILGKTASPNGHRDGLNNNTYIQ